MSRLGRLARAARGQHGAGAPGRPKPGGPVPPLVTGPGIAEAWDMEVLVPGEPAQPGGAEREAPARRDAVAADPPAEAPDAPERPAALPERATPQTRPERTEARGEPEAWAAPVEETTRAIWRVDLPGSCASALQFDPAIYAGNVLTTYNNIASAPGHDKR